MSEDQDEWLKRELGSVLQDIERKFDVASRSGLPITLPATVRYSEAITKNRYDLGVAHLIMAVAYALQEGLERTPPMKEDRTLTDDQIRTMAYGMSWADLQCFFDILGSTLWRALWRP